MPRHLSLQRRLLVNFDCQYCLRDLYWRHVGQENHTAGHPFRFGLLVDGRFSWGSDPQGEKHIGYSEDTFASHVTIRNQGLRSSLVCYDVMGSSAQGEMNDPLGPYGKISSGSSLATNCLKCVRPANARGS
jgi:hypothetical protein